MRLRRRTRRKKPHKRPPAAGQQAETFVSLLDREDVFVIDTETTGFNQSAEIVEFAAIDTTGALRFLELVMPKGKIPKSAINVHGLTRDYLKQQDALPWPEHHDAIHQLLDGKVVIGWSVDFDTRMTRQTCEKYGLPMPSMTSFDMLNHYRNYGPARDSYKLQSVVDAEGLAFDGDAHTAEADARAVLAIMRSLSQQNEPRE